MSELSTLNGTNGKGAAAVIAVAVAALAGAAMVTGVGFLLASSMSGMAVYSDRFEALGHQLANTWLARTLGIKSGASMDSIISLLRDSFGTGL